MIAKKWLPKPQKLRDLLGRFSSIFTTNIDMMSEYFLGLIFLPNQVVSLGEISWLKQFIFMRGKKKTEQKGNRIHKILLSFINYKLDENLNK